MNIKGIVNHVEKYINRQISQIICDVKISSPLESFYYHTAIRVEKVFDLLLDSDRYLNDFLLALRDFLIIFDESIKITSIAIPENNEFGILFDEESQEYYATYDFPDGVIPDFAEQAYMRKKVSTTGGHYWGSLITDSFIYQLTRYKYFKTLAQKLAVYGALFTPDGYTTLISLPTGGGKSLITQTLAYQSEGLTIVVVPTVSLAIDQTIAAKNTIKRENVEDEIFFYSSGMDVNPIISAIDNSKARLLFISPEALLNNKKFVEAVEQANRNRYIRNIIIDEAHIVVDWGTSFRVDYQCLESWRRRLLLSCPTIRTFLLSATFERTCVDVLKKLFSSEEKWNEVRCDSMRHEPRFMLIKEKNRKVKQKKYLELIRKMPHPMIIYVLRPDEAEEIKKILSENGINNVRTFTGKTKAKERETLIDQWKNDEFEIMVATSAFGIGVDKPDVRTVIHLYVPQNANAYYQELGRGGRDTLSCLSIMCVCESDIKTTLGNIQKRVMTAEKILGRWDSMYNNPRSIRNDDLVYIDTTIKPNYHDDAEFDLDDTISDIDMKWNIYVLLLLRRYSFIHITDISISNGKYIFVISILREELRSGGDELVSAIEEIRQIEWHQYNDSFNIMKNVINGKHVDCWSEMFYEAYDKVYEYCGGCNNHIYVIDDDSDAFPLKGRVQAITKTVSLEWERYFYQDEQVIFVNDMGSDEKIIKLLNNNSISTIVSEDEILIDQYQYFDNITLTTPTFIIDYTGLRNLIKKKGSGYLGGVIAVIYPSKVEEAVKLLNALSSLEGSSVRIIHILDNDIYFSKQQKNFTEIVEGKVYHTSML